MKLIKYIVISAIAILALVGCKNDYHSKFGDEYAFVAFSGSAVSASVDTEVKIPIYLSSENGLEATVTIGIGDGTTASSADYTLKTSTINFTKDNWIDTVRVNILPTAVLENVLVLTIENISSNADITTLAPAERDYTITIK